jgi:hypothetical protein
MQGVVCPSITAGHPGFQVAPCRSTFLAPARSAGSPLGFRGSSAGFLPPDGKVLVKTVRDDIAVNQSSLIRSSILPFFAYFGLLYDLPPTSRDLRIKLIQTVTKSITTQRDPAIVERCVAPEALRSNRRWTGTAQSVVGLQVARTCDRYAPSFYVLPACKFLPVAIGTFARCSL